MTLRDRRLLPLVLLACEGGRCGGEPLELSVNGGPGLTQVERRTSSVGSMVWDLDSQETSVHWLVEDNGVAICDADILWHGYLATGYESNTRYCEDCTYEFHINEEIVEDRGETWCNFDPIWTGFADAREDLFRIGVVTDDDGLATQLLGVTQINDGGLYYGSVWYEEVLMADLGGDAPAALVGGDGRADWAFAQYASGVLPYGYHPCGDDVPYIDVVPYGFGDLREYETVSYVGRDALGCGGADSDQWAVTLERADTMEVTVSATRGAELAPAFRVNRPDGCTYVDFDAMQGTDSTLSWQPKTHQGVIADTSGRWTINVVDTGAGCEEGTANYDIDVLIRKDAFGF